MTINEFEIKKIETAADQFLSRKRPPAHLRDQLDLGYKIQDQSIEIMEIRPDWLDNTIFRKYLVAKATYVKSKQHWREFWQRAVLKWHSYRPVPTAKSVEDFLQLVDEDASACFFG